MQNDLFYVILFFEERPHIFPSPRYETGGDLSGGVRRADLKGGKVWGLVSTFFAGGRRWSSGQYETYGM